MKFSREFNFKDFGFLSSAGTNIREFRFQTLLPGITIGSVSLHCLQTISLKFSNVNERSKFSRNFFWWEFVFTLFNFRGSMKNPRNSWMPHGIASPYFLFSTNFLSLPTHASSNSKIEIQPEKLHKLLAWLRRDPSSVSDWMLPCYKPSHVRTNQTRQTRHKCDTTVGGASLSKNSHISGFCFYVRNLSVFSS